MFDFCGIGNACVDIAADIDDSFLVNWNFPKGVCTYITLDTANRLEAALTGKQYIPGGCAANVASCIAVLGGKACFIGRCADDAIGHIFMNDMKARGIRYAGTPDTNPQAGSTRIFALTTPDAERTFAAFYGVQEDLSETDLDREALRDSKILYLDGYALNSRQGGKVFYSAAATAKAAGCRIVFSPNDLSIIEKYPDVVETLMSQADLLLCNENEALALAKTKTLDDAIHALRHRLPMAGVTVGNRGAYVFDKHTMLHSPAEDPPGPVIDANGAGDNFAGGFLYGLSQNFTLEKACKLGQLCAASVLTRRGARPADNYKDFLSRLG